MNHVRRAQRGYLHEIAVERQIVADRVLPALLGGSVVRIVLGDVRVDAGQRELLVRCARDGLYDQLRVGVRRLRVVDFARTVHGVIGERDAGRGDRAGHVRRVVLVSGGLVRGDVVVGVNGAVLRVGPLFVGGDGRGCVGDHHLQVRLGVSVSRARTWTRRTRVGGTVGGEAKTSLEGIYGNGVAWSVT